MSTGVRPATTGIPRLAGSRRPRHDHEFDCSQSEVEIAQYPHLLVAAAVRLTDARELQYRRHAGTVAMQSVTMADNLPGGCCAAQSSPVHGVKGAVARYCDLARSGAVRSVFVEPPVRIELTTYALQERCSTAELRRRGAAGKPA